MIPLFIDLNLAGDLTVVGEHNYDRACGGKIIPPRGTAFPTPECQDEMFLRTDENILYRWDGAAWQSLGGVTLAAGPPVDSDAGAPAVGISTDVARADHKHQVLTAAPVSVGTANAAGASDNLSRADHVHDHGAQTDGTHHAVATGAVNGFMSAADKTKLDGVEAGAAADQNASEVPATAPTFLTGTDVQALIDELDIRGRSIKLTNTDTTTDIDSTVAQSFDELTGAVGWNDDATIFAQNLATGEVTINRTGRYRAEFFASMEAGIANNAARNNLRFWFTLNGTQISPNYQNNYLRDASGHNETSQGGFIEFDATSGQVLQINRQRVAGSGGTQTLQGTDNFLQVTVVR